MPTYSFLCDECGPFEINMSMKEATSVYSCPTCGKDSNRNWSEDLTTIGEIWYTDGSHKRDYGKHGHKGDIIARKYEKATGERAPEPAKLPKNMRREHMYQPKERKERE